MDRPECSVALLSVQDLKDNKHIGKSKISQIVQIYALFKHNKHIVVAINV